ncbi:MAG: hypothetical protein AB4290_22045 [Spirulina sp.]
MINCQQVEEKQRTFPALLNRPYQLSIAEGKTGNEAGESFADLPLHSYQSFHSCQSLLIFSKGRQFNLQGYRLQYEE